MSAPRWVITGTATVSVTLVVEAHSSEEALAKAEDTMSSEWECDEVDGEVTISKDEPPVREDC